jgi:GMP synthase (glutamine-hydrolysing)
VTRPLLIIQPGQKLPSLAGVPGDFSDWVLAGMGVEGLPVSVLHPQQGDVLPDPVQACGVVVTGSSAMVTERLPWMLETEAWLRRVVAQDTPLLGICFGHQLLAHALGGEVADNPLGIEVGTVETRLADEAEVDPLFGKLPATCPVQASHQQSVRSLPPGAVRLAASEQDPHHAFRYGKTAWGVQFHPEFDARIVAAYEAYYAARLTADYLRRQRAARRDHPCGGSILNTFREICHSQ